VFFLSKMCLLFMRCRRSVAGETGKQEELATEIGLMFQKRCAFLINTCIHLHSCSPTLTSPSHPPLPLPVTHHHLSQSPILTSPSHRPSPLPVTHPHLSQSHTLTSSSHPPSPLPVTHLHLSQSPILSPSSAHSSCNPCHFRITAHSVA